LPLFRATASCQSNYYDRGLTDLVGELRTRSEQFRTWWATHNVKLHHRATKSMHHPVAGDLQLTGEALHLPGDPGLTLITYTYEPASPTNRPSPSSPAGAPEKQPRNTAAGRTTTHPQNGPIEARDRRQNEPTGRRAAAEPVTKPTRQLPSADSPTIGRSHTR
jgi:hypothetical protein